MSGARALFEEELRRRGLVFSLDVESGRHVVEINGGRMFVNLDNLERELATGADPSRVTRFVDTVVASGHADRTALDRAQLFWCLEPSDHVDRAEIRASVSDQVDRVLCHWNREKGRITWVNSSWLCSSALDVAEAGDRAFGNLADALRQAKIEISEIDGVKLGMLGSVLPFKAALILAPNAREVLAEKIGWPLHAVVPDREFLYLWDVRHEEFAGRVGGVVVREFQSAAYPVSTELFRLDDTGVAAVGAWPRDDEHPET